MSIKSKVYVRGGDVMEIKKMTQLSMYASLAVALSIFESFLPLINGYTIPGLKLGLASSIILYILYTYAFKEALYVTLLKVFVVALCRTGLFSIGFYLSLVGSLLSVTSMAIIKKGNVFSVKGVSIMGSLMHSLGQILLAKVLLPLNVIHLLPFLILLCIPTGLFTGSIAQQLLKYKEHSI